MIYKEIVGRIEFSEKLPDNWVGLYTAYKEESLRYAGALREIRELIKDENASTILLEEINRIALNALEGDPEDHA